MTRTLRVNVVGALALMGLLLAVAPDAPVADAAMRGDLEAVRTLIKSGADVNAAQGDGMTALHWSAMNGNRDMADLLLYAGAAVDPLTRLGSYTPLHLAAKESRAEVAGALLGAGANVKARTSTGGATALHLAAQSGAVDVINALADKGADVNARDEQWGQTPLMFAAAANRAPAVTALLKRGADPAIAGSTIDMVERGKYDRASEDRRNQLQEAIHANAAAAPQAPRGAPAAAAAPQAQGLRPAINPQAARAAADMPVGREAEMGRYGGLTALHLAARDGLMESVVALLDGGADLNQRSAADNTTPLLVATINGQFDVAKLLVDRGADVAAQADNGEGVLFAVLNAQWTPKSRHPEPADYMLQKTTYMELMQQLLDKGADPKARLKYNVWHIELGSGYLTLDWTGATPFFRATHALDLEAMKLLVKYGSDPSLGTIKVGEGRSRGPAGPDPSGVLPVPPGGIAVLPIHVSTGHGYGDQFVANVHRFVEGNWLPVVKYLVEEHGADVNARDMAGETPLHNAAARGDNELVKYLVSKGADVMAVDRKGRTTVDMANGPQQRVQPLPETIKLLESMGAKNNHKCVSC
ncbi:MAG: ankyrin repeat domain-containing protein [Gemmatimonadetes bacterium]|nr:ankyrin repeat domain-containing protein [Gemmatimonadota bacterium]